MDGTDTVIGKIEGGLEVADEIAATAPLGTRGAPKRPVILKKMIILENEAEVAAAVRKFRTPRRWPAWDFFCYAVLCITVLLSLGYWSARAAGILSYATVCFCLFLIYSVCAGRPPLLWPIWGIVVFLFGSTGLFWILGIGRGGKK